MGTGREDKIDIVRVCVCQESLSVLCRTANICPLFQVLDHIYLTKEGVKNIYGAPTSCQGDIFFFTHKVLLASIQVLFFFN